MTTRRMGTRPELRDRWSPAARDLLGLWPEALLGAVTAAMVAIDGLGTSAGDPGYYWRIAGQIGQGMVPWRDFPFEYPPVSLTQVLLPYFLPGGASISVYLTGLFIVNVLLLVAIGAGVVWLARRGWAVESWPRTGLAYALLALALAPTVMWRFDALPTALTVAALILVARNRVATAGIALGAAVMAKLYPLALLPALAVAAMRNGRLRPAGAIVLACGATILAIAAPFLIVAGRSSLSYLDYAVGRGIQVESLPGALALLASVAGGPDARIYAGYGTWQVDSPLISILGPAWTLLTFVLLGAVALALWRRLALDRAETGGLRPTSEVTQLVAVLMVVLVTSRVLSPQYLFWVVPFIALLPRRKMLVFWLACVLTTFGYPLNFQEMLNQEPLVILVVNLRNAVLVGFMAWVLGPDLMSAIRALLRRVRRPGQGALASR